MIDIHAHVLPQVDDGPANWEESLALLQRGERDGIRGVVCTSHVLDHLNEEIENEFLQKFEELKRRAQEKGLNMSLWLGSEIHIHSQFNVRSKVATINGNGKYILLELPLGNIPQDAGEKIFQLALDGFIPILAHPERNSVIIRKPHLAFDYIQRGVLLQLNAGSVMGTFGKRIKRIAFEMLNHQLIHFIASDCHTPTSRSMILSKAYRIIERYWGTDTAERLFRIHPYKAVIGEEISAPPPIPMDVKGRKTGFFSGLKIFKNR